MINIPEQPDEWDHPRIRGEHIESSYVVFKAEGIIPAYAGSTRGR